MPKFYPISAQQTTTEKTIAYVSITNDIVKHSLIIEISNIHDFTYLFKINSDDEFVNLTFEINQLTAFDRNSIFTIFENIEKIKDGLTISTLNNEFLEFDLDKSLLVLKFEKFQYFIPMKTSDISDELRIIKQIYMNIETFAIVESEIIDLLNIQILNKNLIISKLLNSYYLTINNTNNTSKNANDLYKCKEIQDLFINKQIFKFMGSSSDQTIKNYTRSTSIPSSLFTNNRKLLWDKVFKPNDKPVNLNFMHTSSLAGLIKSTATELEPETETEPQTETESQSETGRETTNLPSIPVKRKLQGLLRRERRQSPN